MKIISSPFAASKFCRAQGKTIVLVPTMGALHEGHLALIRRGRKLAGKNGLLAVSIYVNPIQFGAREDLARYPRPLAADTALCRDNGVDLLFTPSSEAMYSEDFSVSINETLLSTGLCGKSRPGHFSGVCTVVAKLFNIIDADIAVFGLKDYQQASVIRRMVRDLNMSVKIIFVETVRDTDGLALSSRNRYLSPSERAQAPVIRRSLLEAAKSVRDGRGMPARLKQQITKTISSAPLARIDYIEIVDAENLQSPGAKSKELVIALAVYFGKTRLIDNIRLRKS